MECGGVTDSLGNLEVDGTPCDNGVEQVDDGLMKYSDTLGDELLENFDSYWEDINDRLIVSRMVSDSVIKGMVNAVEQEAAGKLVALELELASLRNPFPEPSIDMNSVELIRSPTLLNELHNKKGWTRLNNVNGCGENDTSKCSLAHLRIAAREQFEKLKKEINRTRGCSPIRRNGSCSELVGLGGILTANDFDNGTGIDRTMDALKTILDALFGQMDDILRLPNSYIRDNQQEHEFREKVEFMVIESTIEGLQEEFEGKIWGHENVCSNNSKIMAWLEQINEISSACKELNEILKSCNFEHVSHKTHDMAHIHDKTLIKHLSSASSLLEGNGIGQSRADMLENFEHLTKDEMVNNFNSVITKMRRDHDSQMREISDKYFELKREYLNYKSGFPPVPPKMDREYNSLRKKIPQVISELDAFLLEKEKLPADGYDVDNLSSLKDRIDTLLSENCQLRNLIAEKKNEVNNLEFQISNAHDRISQQSVAESRLVKLIENLTSVMEDEKIKFYVYEEVNKCVLKELSGQIECGSKDAELELIIMQDLYKILLKESTIIAEMCGKCEMEERDILSMTEHDLSNLIFAEAMEDVKKEFEKLCMRYSIEINNKASFEKKLMEKESELCLETEKKQKLMKEISALEMLVEEKETSLVRKSAALTEKSEKFQVVSQELRELEDFACQQQILISDNCIELSLMKSTLEEARGQIQRDKVEIEKLSQRIEKAMVELKEVNEQKCESLSLAQMSQNKLLNLQAQEQGYRKQMKSLIVLIHALSRMAADFESKILGCLKSYNLRLEHTRSDVISLSKEANTLRRIDLLNKKRLERKFSDLQMAEVEVDLLGDEVDALVSLLEKIYVALDHYSPILKHYPGVIEVLKLVRRALSGDFTRTI